jgi:hypothetical protein
VVFFARTGEVKWNGNVANTFKAPSSGPYKGLLIYLPHGNTTTLNINGNAGNHIQGTILAVQAPILLNGNQGTEVMDSQVIGYTVKFNGNGTLRIDFDGSEVYHGDGSETGVVNTPTPAPTWTPQVIPTSTATFIPTSTPTATPGASIQLIQ